MRSGALVLPFLLCACPNGKALTPPPGGEMEQGVRAFHSGRYDEALEHYRRALSEKQNAASLQQARLWNLVGMACRFKHNVAPSTQLQEQEIAAFKKALELEPDFVVSLINLGASYFYAGRKLEAAPYFKRALELAPQHPDAAQLKKMVEEGQSGPGGN